MGVPFTRVVWEGGPRHFVVERSSKELALSLWRYSGWWYYFYQQTQAPRRVVWVGSRPRRYVALLHQCHTNKQKCLGVAIHIVIVIVIGYKIIIVVWGCRRRNISINMQRSSYIYITIDRGIPSLIRGFMMLWLDLNQHDIEHGCFWVGWILLTSIFSLWLCVVML